MPDVHRYWAYKQDELTVELDSRHKTNGQLRSVAVVSPVETVDNLAVSSAVEAFGIVNCNFSSAL